MAPLRIITLFCTDLPWKSLLIEGSFNYSRVYDLDFNFNFFFFIGCDRRDSCTLLIIITFFFFKSSGSANKIKSSRLYPIRLNYMIICTNTAKLNYQSFAWLLLINLIANRIQLLVWLFIVVLDKYLQFCNFGINISYVGVPVLY